MRRNQLALVLLASSCLCACVHGASLRSVPSMLGKPSQPVWPDAMELEYTITLPYVESVQPIPLRYPVHLYYDGPNQRMRMGFYNDMDAIYVLPGTTYNVYPRITTPTCMALSTGGGPTLMGSSSNDDMLPPLPDLSGWEYAGTSQLKGQPPGHVWQLTERHEERVNTYTFHVAQADGRPLHLVMMGVNLFTGSHFDHYDISFKSYKVGTPNVDVFQPPSLCDKVRVTASPKGLMQAAVYQSVGLLPSSLTPSGNPAVSKSVFKRGSWAENIASLISDIWLRSSGAEESVTQQNLKAIQKLNIEVAESAANNVDGPVKPRDMYTLAPNQFVHMDHDQWAATRLGRVPGQSRLKSQRSSARLGVYQRVLPDHKLPKSVDWRGTGADGPVKDQASCGSCWAFATAGAMTGAWWKATGQSLSFSEQQIVDCSWDYDVNGCWGGNVEPALTYIHDRGGIALEDDYPYRGQNSICRENKTARAAVFKGFLSIPADEKAVMEALYLHGPLGIAFDAGHITFKYYSGGVYYREDCGQTADDLDHAVVLVGYGTTPSGTDYWILRNSWSQMWGEGGYFKLARKGNDCGVTLDVTLAVPDEEAVSKARAIMASK